MHTILGQTVSVHSPDIERDINSVTNLQNMVHINCNYSNFDLLNTNVFTKFGPSLYIVSQDIERKRNSDTKFVTNLQNNDTIGIPMCSDEYKLWSISVTRLRSEFVPQADILIVLF